MGRGKQKPQRNGRRGRRQNEEDPLPSSAFEISVASSIEELPAEEALYGQYQLSEGPSKYELYQTSVQSPKGDISYLQKFFLLYIGGRSPVHLREDFCGTALICAEWLKGGIQRLATGLDLDLEALKWGLSNNFKNLGGNACDRVHLLHGNVLQPLSSAKVVSASADAVVNPTAFVDSDQGPDADDGFCANSNDGLAAPRAFSKEHVALVKRESSEEAKFSSEGDNCKFVRNIDIVCAFNYSCCCLHTRPDLVLYFKHVFDALSAKGGIFAMDLYGGVSSETHLKLRRHFPDFTYVWEQEAFDVINRMTKISLHFQLKNNRMIRHAFTYHWRLWSLPEVRDCLREAGFNDVHFWVREMPSLEEREDNEDTWDEDSKYEEATVFYQQSAWNAYIVAAAPQKKV
ncbi:hypothetical protein GOP47_0018597 [Adiantum capillus-veneris]|uniref:Uncharacterized protein n=1 Tax=Adiantum capillus-veneris TaxID=13818 RepID=A0A9D4UEG1_ADICA|nr:hypothetical protein GOP47_0018597 [Adiantum capillus-veneris]